MNRAASISRSSLEGFLTSFQETKSRMFIIYDIPTPVVVNGSGRYKSYRHLWVIKRMIKSGWVVRLGDSFIEILEPEAIAPVLDVLKDAGAKYFVILGEIIDQK